MNIGHGQYTAQITERGGTPLVAEIPWTSLSFPKVQNNSAQASVSVPTCENLTDVEPYEHELSIWRDNTQVFVGPITEIEITQDNGSLRASDLFHWMDLRFIGDFHGNGDVADIFFALFEHAIAADSSPNIAISTQRTGVDGIRDFRAVEFHRASDAMRELARSGLDFIVIGRQIVVGAHQTESLLLHDDGVTKASVVKEGSNLATDVSVFGATLSRASAPVIGRSVTGIDRFGLIQRSFTELLVKDRVSADANADARVQAMQPSPRRLKVTLTDKAAFAFEDIVAGRSLDVRLTVGDMAIEQTMRLQQATVNVTAGQSETVVFDCIPVGVT